MSKTNEGNIKETNVKKKTELITSQLANVKELFGCW